MIQKLTVVGLILSVLSGCAEENRDKQLHKVARDWCTTIRASQIIPVYPLTEDLQVGDLFLVQYPVEEQHKQYKEDGFLPLDSLIDRVDPCDFHDFYDFSFDDTQSDTLVLPKTWLKQNSPWTDAPGASFPTYSFSVEEGKGVSLAVPVHGVPVGLSLMGAGAASGEISISKAKTYGIDTISLYDQVRNWERENHAFLKNFAQTDDRTNYIRVVSRVYLAGQMNIGIHAAESWAGGLSAGEPKPLELLTMRLDEEGKTRTADINDYANSIGALNKSIADAIKKDNKMSVMPGGTLKIVSASARGISMVETFDRPLAVGYLGFDMAIGPDGMLGPPIPTRAVVADKVKPGISDADFPTLAFNAAYMWIYRHTAEDKHAERLKGDLDRSFGHVPDECVVSVLFRPDGHTFPTPDDSTSDKYQATRFSNYYAKLRTSLEYLESLPGNDIQRQHYLVTTRAAKAAMDLFAKQHRSLIQEAIDYWTRF